MGSTWSIRRTRSLAAEEIESQLPPDREIFPSPIRARMSSAVSSGPVAKGVELEGPKQNHMLKWPECGRATPHGGHMSHDPRGYTDHYTYMSVVYRLLFRSSPSDQRLVDSYPASMVYRRTPRLQMSMAAS